MRSEANGEATKDRVLRELGTTATGTSGKLKYELLELSDPASIESFANKWVASSSYMCTSYASVWALFLSLFRWFLAQLATADSLVDVSLAPIRGGVKGGASKIRPLLVTQLV